MFINIWPLTIAILNLWAICKVIWFVITFIIGSDQGCQGLETVVCLVAKLQHLFRIIIVLNTLQKRRVQTKARKVRTSIPQSKQSRWKYNHVTRYRNETKSMQNKFCHTRQWQRLRKIVFERDYHICASIVKLVV